MPLTRAATIYRYEGLDRLSSSSDDLPGTTAAVALGFTFNTASQMLLRTRSIDACRFTGHVAVNRSYAVNGLNPNVSAGLSVFSYDANRPRASGMALTLGITRYAA